MPRDHQEIHTDVSSTEDDTYETIAWYIIMIVGTAVAVGAGLTFLIFG